MPFPFPGMNPYLKNSDLARESAHRRWSLSHARFFVWLAGLFRLGRDCASTSEPDFYGQPDPDSRPTHGLCFQLNHPASWLSPTQQETLTRPQPHGHPLFLQQISVKKAASDR